MKRLVFALLLAAQPVAAADALYDLYAQGQYEEAIKAGAAAGDARGYAIAARAALAEAVLGDRPCLPCLKRAENFAQQAVAADPHDAYGQIWLAVALGYEARITGIMRARLSDAPARSRAALDQAVKDEPQNPFAVSALGGWHVEVVRGGGAFLSRSLYGATLEQGMQFFDRAIRIAPDNVAVRYQIALSLAGFDSQAYRRRIGVELDAAIAAPAVTAYEHAMQDRARALKTALGGNVFAFDALVRKYQGYP